MNRRTRAAVLAAALLLPLGALGVWYGLKTQLDDVRDGNNLGELLMEEGYLEPAPPSRLYGPGTINMVETRPDGKLRLHRTCTVPEDALTPMWVVSEAGHRNFANHAQDEMVASAEARRFAGSEAAAQRVTRITVSLQDMRVVTMSHEDLIKVQREYITGSCEEVVVHNLKAGAKVCQTDEVLQADLVYRVSYADGLEITEKADIAKQISASLNLTEDSSQVDELRGENLFYGIKLRLNCFNLKNDDRPKPGPIAAG